MFGRFRLRRFGGCGMVKNRGLTLLEVAVMLVIISLVSLISYTAISTGSVETRSRPSLLAVARVVATEQTFASAHGRFTPAPSQLFGLGRDLTVTDSASTSSGVVSLAVSEDDTLVVAALGAEDTCFITSISSLSVGAEVSEWTLLETCLTANFLPPGEVPLPPDPV